MPNNPNISISHNNAEVFSQNADLFKIDYWRQDEQEAIKYLKPGRLLIGGVGAGRTVPHMVEKGFAISAVDISSEMIKICKQRFPDLDARVMDLQATSFVGESFDSIFLPFHTIAYVDDLTTTLREMKRILKPGGRLLFSIPNYWYIRNIISGAIFEGRRRSTNIGGKKDGQIVSTFFLTFLDKRWIKNIFSSVRVAGRMSIPHIAHPNWKDRLLHLFPFFDKSLYFFCEK